MPREVYAIFGQFVDKNGLRPHDIIHGHVIVVIAIASGTIPPLWPRSWTAELSIFGRFWETRPDRGIERSRGRK